MLFIFFLIFDMLLADEDVWFFDWLLLVVEFTTGDLVLTFLVVSDELLLVFIATDLVVADATFFVVVFAAFVVAVAFPLLWIWLAALDSESLNDELVMFDSTDSWADELEPLDFDELEVLWADELELFDSAELKELALEVLSLLLSELERVSTTDNITGTLALTKVLADFIGTWSGIVTFGILTVPLKDWPLVTLMT